MVTVSRPDSNPDWTQARQRIVVAAHKPAIVGAVLGGIAVVEAVLRAALTDLGVQGGLVLCLLALVTTTPLAALPRTEAAVATVAASVISLAMFHTLTVGGALAVLIVLYRLGAASARLLTAALGLPFLALAVTGATDSTGTEAWLLTILLASLAPAAAMTGHAIHTRHEAAEHHMARRAIAGELIEHTARGERSRISRELHDIVAHHISMIAVQAETARLTTPGMPAAGAQRLSSIGDTARAALTEMRRLLGVLRDDVGAGPDDRQPQPDLRGVNELVDAARDASGTGSRLIVTGQPLTLDPGVELAAYRIIQEALTNTRRHAPGAAVDVELRYTDHRLTLRIRDNGPGPPTAPPDGTHGLLGMRERATAVGGELHTGPALGGGFLVTANLPGATEDTP